MAEALAIDHERDAFTVEGYRAWKREHAFSVPRRDTYRFDRRYPLLPERPLAAIVRQSVHAQVSETEWRAIRETVRHEWRGRCAVCGSPSKPYFVAPHYRFDEATAVATLRRLVPLCQACFLARYVARRTSDGHIPRQVLYTLQARNQCDLATVMALIAEADATFNRRSPIPWHVELGPWREMASAVN